MKAAARRLAVKADIRLKIIPAHRHQFESYATDGGMFAVLTGWLEDEPARLWSQPSITASLGLDIHHVVAARAPSVAIFDHIRGY